MIVTKRRLANSTAVSGTATMTDKGRIGGLAYRAYPRRNGVLVDQLQATSNTELAANATWQFTTTSNSDLFSDFNQSLTFSHLTP